MAKLRVGDHRDQGEKLDDLGAVVLGVSPQSVDSHERFVEEKRLNVPLLADEDKEVARAYGVLAGLTYESVDDLERAVAASG